MAAVVVLVVDTSTAAAVALEGTIKEAGMISSDRTTCKQASVATIARTIARTIRATTTIVAGEKEAEAVKSCPLATTNKWVNAVV